MTKFSDSAYLLSIIIPVYNRQDSLEQLLSDLSVAIVSGGFKSLVELIVIDDGSTTAIKIPVFEFPVQLYRLKQNSGAPKARELGFQKSSGQFIHFHDSDDSISNNWLGDIIKALENNPETDLLLTGRVICGDGVSREHYQRFFHRHVNNIKKIKHRLVYQNCIGPLGGITFSRRVISEINFSKFVACQDWQMYLSVMPFVKKIQSCPQIQFYFNISQKDRISSSPNRKLLGHLQLSKITSKETPFMRRIRLFYLYECKRYLEARGGYLLIFYQKNRITVYFNHLLIKAYWRLSELLL